jgi:hypothetical protein
MLAASRLLACVVVATAALSGAAASSAPSAARLPSIAKAVFKQKLTLGVEINHAELPPPSARGLGVSIHHQNLYDESDSQLRVLPIRQMSQDLRLGVASILAIRGMGDLLAHAAAEQRAAKGEFPGPLPILYVQPVGETADQLDAAAVAAAGASAVLLQCSAPLPSADALAALDALAAAAAAAKAAGLEVAVEFAVGVDVADWDAAAAAAAFARAEAACGCDLLVLTQRGAEVVPLPPAYRGKVLASLRMPWSQIDDVCDALRDAGYPGAVLRSECMPMSAATVGDWADFWVNLIANARSNKSKSVVMMVAKQQKRDAMRDYVAKVKASGQFGDLKAGASLGGTDAINTANGDYVGF